MGEALLTIWIIGSIAGYFYFKTNRVDHPRLSAIFWPIVGLVLLAGALSNPNGSIRRTIDSRSGSTGGGSVGTAPVPPADAPIERPKYGLIDSEDD
ncbi:MAG: hypothetical protein ACR2H2_13345 [Solirubrobacteraceae bacterium]